MSRLAHLARRFAGSLSRVPAPHADVDWAVGFLLPPEAGLWSRFGPADQRHSILVARRFLALRPDASRPEVAGALLHDIGKLDSGLGTISRVVATVVGPRGDRFRRYHDHERIGAEMLVAAGSDPETIALVTGGGAAAADLAAADDI